MDNHGLSKIIKVSYLHWQVFEKVKVIMNVN